MDEQLLIPMPRLTFLVEAFRNKYRESVSPDIKEFFDSLTPAEQEMILIPGALFGAIRVMAENVEAGRKENKS